MEDAVVPASVFARGHDDPGHLDEHDDKDRHGRHDHDHRGHHDDHGGGGLEAG